MVLEVVYVVRHGYRSNWAVDPQTGTYSSSIRSPTGITSDPALASYGVLQSEQLAPHLLNLNPPADLLYSSPYYRNLQTLAPFMHQLQDRHEAKNVRIFLEQGLGDFYGRAKFTHPSPAGVEELRKHFDFLADEQRETIIVPSVHGEGIKQIHDRVAYCLDRLIHRADADPAQPKALLVCTHAAPVICAGRALTGRMPDEIGETDFHCFTCGVSKFNRRSVPDYDPVKEREAWDDQRPDEIPDVGWRGGKGVAGGWDCEFDSDCSFLENGEERGWNFWMEEQRIQKLEAELAAASATPSDETVEL